MPIRIRHRHRVDQKLVGRFPPHRHRVGTDVVILPDRHPLLVEQVLPVVEILGGVHRVHATVGRQLLPHRRPVPLVVLRLLKRTNDSLSDPSQIVHAGRLRIDINVERGNPLHERLILHDHHRRLGNIRSHLIVRGETASQSRRLRSKRVYLRNGLIEHVLLLGIRQRHLLLDELPTHLHPAVAEDQKVLHGTAERSAEIVMPPHMVHNRLHKGGPVAVLRLIGGNDNLRMVHRHRRGNHIHRRKRQIHSDQIALRRRGPRPVPATVQVVQPPPSLIETLLVAPTTRTINALPVLIQGLTASLARHQKYALSGNLSILRP